MIEEGSVQRLGIRRVLVAVDTSTENYRMLEAAADLAALMQAELFGLFVEDPLLLKLEDHPTTRKIDLPGGLGGEIEKGSMQRELRALSRRAQDLIARASEQRHVEWSFETVRGAVEAELESETVEGDLVVAGSAGRTIQRGMRMEPTTKSAVETLDRPVLYLQHGPRPTRSIVAVYDGTPEREAVLDAAIRMFGGPVSLLTVLLVAEDREEAETLREEAEGQLTQAGIPAHYRRVSTDSNEWIADAVDSVHGDFLIQSAHCPCLEDETVDELLDSVDCPVLLMR